MDTSEATTHVSLCAGYGGIDLGLKRVVRDLRTVAYCERDAYPVANLVSKIEAGRLDPAPIWSDLKTFPWGKFRGLVDILSGGYPCQPFSMAGLRGGDRDKDGRHLWPWIRDGVGVMQPEFCFFENVDGHVSLGLSTVLADLEEIGYRTAWGLFSAAGVGACHERRRVFILAHSLRERGQFPAQWVIPAVEDAGGEIPSGGADHRWSDHTSWPAEPCLRGDDDGFASRVDRLRLAGNGVVPRVAEHAFRILLPRLIP